jgi:NADP-dependent 3-hydroxy acid dehydrogenase YdfG
LVLSGWGEGFSAIDDITLTSAGDTTRIDYRVTLTFDKAPAKLASAVTRRLFLRNVRRAARQLAALFNGTAPLPRVTLPVFAGDHAILPGLMGFTRLGYRLAHRHRPFAAARLRDRTVVITGATGGIGLAAAQSLHGQGARLIIVGRDREKTAAICRRLAGSGDPDRVRMEIADMSLMADVRALAHRLGDNPSGIHVLINNAGALFNQRELTTEGIERSFAVNLLGPYALSRWLLPALRRSRPARIINVASGGMYTVTLRWANSMPSALKASCMRWYTSLRMANWSPGLVLYLTRMIMAESSISRTPWDLIGSSSLGPSSGSSM